MIRVNDLDKVQKLIREYKIPYTRRYTNYSSTIDCKLGKFHKGDYMGRTLFSYMAKLKKEVRNSHFYNSCPDSVITSEFVAKLRKRITYYRCNYDYVYSNKKYNMMNLRVADLSGAYWRTLLNMQIVSKEFYKEVTEKFNKKSRLKLTGSLGTSKLIEHYDKNGKIIHKEIQEDLKLRYIWFNLCSAVNETMEIIASRLKDDFIFYWVDGVYFKWKQENSDLVEYYLRNNYDYTLDFCNILISGDRTRNLEIRYNDGEIKKFRL